MSLPLAPEPARPARCSTEPLVRSRAAETPYDYCLLPYEPASRMEGRLHSLNLLRESFALAGVERQGMAIVEALRSGLGESRTVYGIKHRGAALPPSWELYFYRRARGDAAPPELAQVLELLGPHVRIDAALDRPLPLLMFSVEVTPEQLVRGVGDGVSVYLQGEDLSYELRGRTLTMGNLYRFYDPQTEVRELLSRMAQLVHFDGTPRSLARLLPPRLRRCHHVCAASKRHADGMYFSRIELSSLRWFLDAHDWPETLQRFVASHAADLDHLSWDVGWDFVLRDGELCFGKSGVYGYF